MGWFDDFKAKIKTVTVSSAGGEWAALAMACVVFADGEAEDSEIESAKVACATNPVIQNSIGQAKAEKIFNDAVAAIKTVPSAMLPSYEAKLQDLAKQVTKAEDKNFALATVLAVALADGEIEPAEKQMLDRMKGYIGATIDIP